jgi:hypothetical protein
MLHAIVVYVESGLIVRSAAPGAKIEEPGGFVGEPLRIKVWIGENGEDCAATFKKILSTDFILNNERLVSVVYRVSELVGGCILGGMDIGDKCTFLLSRLKCISCLGNAFPFVAFILGVNPARENMWIRKVFVEKKRAVWQIRPSFWIAQPSQTSLRKYAKQRSKHCTEQTVAVRAINKRSLH